MKSLITLICACVLATASMAQTPGERLEQAVLDAKVRADQKAYDEAAAIFEKTAGDQEITTLEKWPDTLLPRARYQALAGQTDKAIGTLLYAADMGALNADMAKEPDLTSVRERPEFKALTARLEREDALWKDDPALATPYKPVLSEAEKVAGLSKIWSEARFNFPFFGRIADVNWDAQYMAYLQQVRAAKTTEQYYRVLTRYVASLRDGHTRIIAPQELHPRLYAVAPLSTRLIERKVIVTDVEDTALAARGVVPGIELVSIDGRDVFAYATSEVEPFVFGFSPQDRAAWTYGIELLRGPLDKPLHLTFRLADGKLLSTIVNRRVNKGGYFPENPIPAEFKMLPGNIAYLRIQEFVDDAALKTLQANFAVLSKSGGLIIDIRHNGGGKDDNMIPILKVLANRPYAGLAWRSRNYVAALRSWHEIPGWTRRVYATQQPNGERHYAGPVVVLTGATTYSSAEHFTSEFQIMKRGTVLGEPTGGSLGNPFVFRLPGGGTALICTKDDYFPDGRLFNGTGIQPDITVTPTIADIREGRDRALERAVSLLKQEH